MAAPEGPGGAAADAFVARSTRTLRVNNWALARVVAFSFCVWFKPSEAFLYTFYRDKGFDAPTVNDDILGVYSWAHLPALVACGVLAEVVGYKSVVVLGTACGVFTTATVLLSDQLGVLVAGQWAVSAALASHAAISALALRCVAPESHSVASVAVKTATLTGLGSSALLGQALVTLRDTQLRTLFQVSLIGQVLALVLAFVLPSARISEASLRKDRADSESSEGGGRWHVRGTARASLAWLGRMACDLWRMLCEPIVMLWTVWGITNSAVQSLVMTYWQSLVSLAGRGNVGSGDDASLRNGYALAAAYAATGIALLLGGCSAAGKRSAKPSGWPWQVAALVLSPALVGALLLAMSATSTTFGIYAELMGSEVVHQCAQALASASVAGTLIRRSGALPAFHDERQLLLVSSTSDGSDNGSEAGSEAGIETIGGGRLALLFTMTAASAAAAQMGMLRGLRALNGDDGIVRWFSTLGCFLLATAALLLVAALLLRARLRRAASDAGARAFGSF